MQAPRMCKRCLLTDMEDEQDLYTLIRSRIALLTHGERASDGEYARRLALCKRCDQLNGGTCMQCGCYVEMRAAKQTAHCPHIQAKW